MLEVEELINEHVLGFDSLYGDALQSAAEHVARLVVVKKSLEILINETE